MKLLFSYFVSIHLFFATGAAFLEDLKMKDIMFHIVVCCVIDFRRAEKPHLELLLFNDFFSPTHNVLDQSEAGRGLFKKEMTR